jgi:CRP-like cAMP-binding protein
MTEEKKQRGRGRPFQPGQSGNPAGRPRVVGEIRDLARAKGPAALEILMAIAEDADKPAAARVAAATALLDRGYGRPAQDGEEKAETIGSQVGALLAELERDRKARAEEPAEPRRTAH